MPKKMMTNPRWRGTFQICASKGSGTLNIAQMTIKLSLLCVLAYVCFTGYVMAQVPAEGLVAYYPFTGNANDESGNGNNGIVNGATLTTDRCGNASSAYYFNGINANITTINTPALFNPNEFTISFWFKTNPIIVRVSMMIELYPSFYTLVYETKFQCEIDSSIHGWVTGFDSAQCFNHNWHHFAIEYSYSNSRYDMFVDGIEKLPWTINPLIDQPIEPLRIGCSKLHNNQPAALDYFFQGSIDDIRIYNRALNASEIENLYQEIKCDYQRDIFFIPNTFSPNGDNINDVFFINGLTSNATLKIFDRLGTMVFKSANYDNSWTGIDSKGNSLPTATYWYVLTSRYLPTEYRGFVYLKR